jgi:hypothetical protein
MLSPWSRAGQQVIATCPGRCQACGPGLLGRFNCWGARVHAKRYHSGTFLYSAILAGACIVDSSAKAIRNKEWETALSKAKEDVESIEKIAEERANRLLASESSATETIREALRTNIWEDEDDPDTLPTPLPEPSHNYVPLTVGSVLRYPIEVGGLRPRWPQSTVPITSKWEGEALPPQSLWSSDNRRKIAGSREWYPKRLCIVEVEAMRLVLHLMMVVGLNEKSEIDLEDMMGSDCPVDVVHSYARHSIGTQRRVRQLILQPYIWEHIHPLKPWEDDQRPEFSVVSPNYKRYLLMAPEDARESTRNLNYKIYREFDKDKLKSTSLQHVVLLICDHLLRSPAPPNIETLNVILLGFEGFEATKATSNRHRVDLVNAVVNFRRSTPIRVNELYCAGILRHYRQTDKPRAFLGFITKMRAERGHLMLAKPDVFINTESKGRLRRREDGRVAQAVHPMPMVFWEMLKGVLKFAGFDQAIEVCQLLKEDAWGMDWRCLRSLMFDCVRRANWEDGRIVWEEMLTLAERTRDVPHWILASILALCKVCNQYQEFEEVFEEAMDRGYDLEKLVKALDYVLANVRGEVWELGPRGYTRKAPVIEERPAGHEELAAAVREFILHQKKTAKAGEARDDQVDSEELGTSNDKGDSDEVP